MKTLTLIFSILVSMQAFAQSWTYVGPQGVVSTSGTTTAFNEDLFFFNDTLYMSYSFGSPGSPNDIYLKKWDGSAWQNVATFNAPRTIRQGDIEIAPNGTIYAVYSYQAGPSVQAAQVFSYNGSTWTKMGDSIPNFTGAVDLLIDGSNNIYLANYTNVRKWNGSSFQIISSGMILGIGDGFMYADANDNIYVAYSIAPGADYKMTLAKYDGSTWSSASDTVDVTLANFIDLDADAAGNLYLGLKDVAPTPFPTVMKLVGGVWQPVGNATSLPTGNIFSFDVDTAGNPLISSDSYTGIVYQYNGSTYGKLDSIEVTSALIQVLQVEVDPATNEIYVMLTELVGSNAARSVMKYNGSGVGINSVNLVNSARIYPNPVTNNLTVELQAEAGSIYIMDLTGKVVLSQELMAANNTIDLTSLTAGIYLVSIETAEGLQLEKLVKE